MRTEIQIAGFGGQGIVLAGVILGEAAILDGQNAVQTQSYGPESRGGAARSDIIISRTEIDYPKVLQADLLVALSQPAFDKYLSGAGEGTLVIVDRELVPSQEGAHLAISFSVMAENLGRRVVANSVMLGFITAVSGIVSSSAMEQSLSRNVPPKTVELNLRAFAEGWSAGKEHVDAWTCRGGANG
ncbi:2-oxoacid:acceptor oxidoreductase family protein [bacterium]|nr:2-oxoacid:acceptor oxidoreductase family protein [bacterium]